MRLSVMKAGRSRAAIFSSIFVSPCATAAETYGTNLSLCLIAPPAVDLCRLRRYSLFELQQHIGSNAGAINDRAYMPGRTAP